MTRCFNNSSHCANQVQLANVAKQPKVKLKQPQQSHELHENLARAMKNGFAREYILLKQGFNSTHLSLVQSQWPLCCFQHSSTIWPTDSTVRTCTIMYVHLFQNLHQYLGLRGPAITLHVMTKHSRPIRKISSRLLVQEDFAANNKLQHDSKRNSELLVPSLDGKVVF